MAGENLFQNLGGFDLGGLASGASPYPVGTAPTPSSSGSSNFSQNGPTLPAPDLGTPQNTMYNRMSSVLGNPSQIAQDPAYKFLFDQGMQGLNRTMAAKKMAMSGNAGLGAINFGQGLASNYFNQMMPQLLAGSAQELQRYQVPGQLEVQKYGASHGGASMGNQSQQGANPGTQADYGARDLLARIAQGGGSGGMAPSYGGNGAGYSNTRSLGQPGGGMGSQNPAGGGNPMPGQGGSIDDFMSQLGFGGAGDQGGGFDWGSLMGGGGQGGSAGDYSGAVQNPQDDTGNIYDLLAGGGVGGGYATGSYGNARGDAWAPQGWDDSQIYDLLGSGDGGY